MGQVKQKLYGSYGPEDTCQLGLAHPFCRVGGMKMLSIGASFWVLLICVAAFEVLRLRSRTLRALLQRSTSLNWLFTSVFLGACGTIALILAMSARVDQPNWASVTFSVVIFVLGVPIPFALPLSCLCGQYGEEAHQHKRSLPS